MEEWTFETGKGKDTKGNPKGLLETTKGVGGKGIEYYKKGRWAQSICAGVKTSEWL